MKPLRKPDNRSTRPIEHYFDAEAEREKAEREERLADALIASLKKYDDVARKFDAALALKKYVDDTRPFALPSDV